MRIHRQCSLVYLEFYVTIVSDLVNQLASINCVRSFVVSEVFRHTLDIIVAR